MKKQNIVIFLLFFIFKNIIFAYEENYNDFKALLVGNGKGEIIKVENPEEIRPMASITKLMTSLLILESIELGKIKYEDKVIISAEASKIPYGVKLKEGKEYTVKDLLKATIIKSSNSAAYALGEYLDGNIVRFIKRMNKRAKELKLSSLEYCSPHGLPPKYTGSCMDSGNVLDIYKLSMEVVKHKGYINISKNAKDQMGNGEINLISTNNLLGKVQGVDGLKTGYHNAAGSSIVLTAKREKDRVFVVIMGSEKVLNRDAIGKREIENYYNGVKIIPEKNSDKNKEKSYFKIIDKETLLDIIVIENKEYGIYPTEDVFEQFTENEKVDMEFEISLKENLIKLDKDMNVGVFVAINKITNKGYIGNLVAREIK